MGKPASMFAIMAVVVLLCGTVVQGRQQQDARIIAAAKSTLTALSLTTVSTTVPLTCITAISSSSVCRKRKKKYMNTLMQLHSISESNLDASQGANVDNDAVAIPGNDGLAGDEASRDPRLAITIWTTLYSPFTYTSTSTNNQVTFSVSFQCTYPGQSFPSPCGG